MTVPPWTSKTSDIESNLTNKLSAEGVTLVKGSVINQTGGISCTVIYNKREYTITVGEDHILNDAAQATASDVTKIWAKTVKGMIEVLEHNPSYGSYSYSQTTGTHNIGGQVFTNKELNDAKQKKDTTGEIRDKQEYYKQSFEEQKTIFENEKEILDAYKERSIYWGNDKSVSVNVLNADGSVARTIASQDALEHEVDRIMSKWMGVNSTDPKVAAKREEIFNPSVTKKYGPTAITGSHIQEVEINLQEFKTTYKQDLQRDINEVNRLGGSSRMMAMQSAVKVNDLTLGPTTTVTANKKPFLLEIYQKAKNLHDEIASATNQTPNLDQLRTELDLCMKNLKEWNNDNEKNIRGSSDPTRFDDTRLLLQKADLALQKIQNSSSPLSSMANLGFKTKPDVNSLKKRATTLRSDIEKLNNPSADAINKANMELANIFEDLRFWNEDPLNKNKTKTVFDQIKRNLVIIRENLGPINKNFKSNTNPAEVLVSLKSAEEISALRFNEPYKPKPPTNLTKTVLSGAKAAGKAIIGAPGSIFKTLSSQLSNRPENDTEKGIELTDF